MREADAFVSSSLGGGGNGSSGSGKAPPFAFSLGVVGVRLDNRVQNESLSARVLAIGEVVRESTEPGVEVPDPGELGLEGSASNSDSGVIWVDREGLGDKILISSSGAKVTFPGVGVGNPVASVS